MSSRVPPLRRLDDSVDWRTSALPDIPSSLGYTPRAAAALKDHIATTATIGVRRFHNKIPRKGDRYALETAVLRRAAMAHDLNNPPPASSTTLFDMLDRRAIPRTQHSVIGSTCVPTGLDGFLPLHKEFKDDRQRQMAKKKKVIEKAAIAPAPRAVSVMGIKEYEEDPNSAMSPEWLALGRSNADSMESSVMKGEQEQQQRAQTAMMWDDAMEPDFGPQMPWKGPSAQPESSTFVTDPPPSPSRRKSSFYGHVEGSHRSSGNMAGSRVGSALADPKTVGEVDWRRTSAARESMLSAMRSTLESAESTRSATETSGHSSITQPPVTFLARETSQHDLASQRRAQRHQRLTPIGNSRPPQAHPSRALVPFAGQQGAVTPAVTPHHGNRPSKHGAVIRLPSRESDPVQIGRAIRREADLRRHEAHMHAHPRLNEMAKPRKFSPPKRASTSHKAHKEELKAAEEKEANRQMAARQVQLPVFLHANDML